MIFRRKLLAVFALTVVVSVVAVAWSISFFTRRAFEKADEERSTALVKQFRREFIHRGEDIVRRIETIAASENTTRIALALSHGSPDFGAYLNDARAIADNQQLDFLEFTDGQGAVISSAQWPAKFGYNEPLIPLSPTLKDAFLKQEDLPDGEALGLFAVREVSVGEKALFVVGGRRIDKNFLASLELPSGMRAMLYQNLGAMFSPQFLIDASGALQQTDRLALIIRQLQQQPRETTTLVHWSSDTADDETIDAIPLTGRDKQLLGILLIGSSRRPYVELQRQIRLAALSSGAAGILLAILLSGWAAARVIRPVEQLAQASREVAAGNWNAQAVVDSTDEIGELADSFNRMTRELLAQQEQLLQAERVAAWREVARRLAHELKNPLFPLQLTVENLLRARQQPPQQFEEILQESSATLLAEIANLKTIVARFSEFSRMPQPQFQQLQLNEVVQNTGRLFQAQISAPEHAVIACQLDLADRMQPIAADPELLHRALSNLVSNAVDAMPQGGTLTLLTREEGDLCYIEVSDTGIGLTPEECANLFTPYYTTKTHGTGLGLAIVQSIISDHGGRVYVRSKPGIATTFVIALPRNMDKLPAVRAERDAASRST